jgi:hypothetical protein
VEGVRHEATSSWQTWRKRTLRMTMAVAEVCCDGVWRLTCAVDRARQCLRCLCLKTSSRDPSTGTESGKPIDAYPWEVLGVGVRFC